MHDLPLPRKLDVPHRAAFLLLSGRLAAAIRRVPITCHCAASVLRPDSACAPCLPIFHAAQPAYLAGRKRERLQEQ